MVQEWPAIQSQKCLAYHQQIFLITDCAKRESITGSLCRRQVQLSPCVALGQAAPPTLCVC